MYLKIKVFPLSEKKIENFKFKLIFNKNLLHNNDFMEKLKIFYITPKKTKTYIFFAFKSMQNLKRKIVSSSVYVANKVIIIIKKKKNLNKTLESVLETIEKHRNYYNYEAKCST
jgi:hypothetical protein